MGIFHSLFAKKNVVGLDLFHAPGKLSIQAAIASMPVQPALAINLIPEDLIDEIVTRADRALRLKGKLLAFLKTRRNEVHVHFHDQPITDDELLRFLYAEYAGKRWKVKRYESHARTLAVIVVFS